MLIMEAWRKFKAEEAAQKILTVIIVLTVILIILSYISGIGEQICSECGQVMRNPGAHLSSGECYKQRQLIRKDAP